MTKIKKYAGFNVRMWASTIDTIIAYFTLDPLVNYLLKLTGKPEVVQESSGFSDATIQQLANLQNPNVINTLIAQATHDTSGWFADWALESILQSVALLLFSAICWKLWSATPGKIICKIKVVDANSEEPMSDKQILLRCLGYIVSCAVLFLGIFWIGFDKRKQGWHDKIANTVVIRKLSQKEQEAQAAEEKLRQFLESTQPEPRRF